jgi:hypothetical protein
MQVSIVLCLDLEINLFPTSKIVDYEEIAKKLVSQFPVEKDVPLVNIYVNGSVCVEKFRYEFNATDFVWSGAKGIKMTEIIEGKETPKEGANTHDITFDIAFDDSASLKATVKFIKTDPKPADPEKSVEGKAGLRQNSKWIYRLITHINANKRTVDEVIPSPLGNPHIGVFDTQCGDVINEAACPIFNKNITSKYWKINAAITRYIKKTFEAMKF